MTETASKHAKLRTSGGPKVAPRAGLKDKRKRAIDGGVGAIGSMPRRLHVETFQQA